MVNKYLVRKQSTRAWAKKTMTLEISHINNVYKLYNISISLI